MPLPVELLARAPCPTAMFCSPFVLLKRALTPTAVLLLPVVVEKSLNAHGRIESASGVELERIEAESCVELASGKA